MALLAVIDLIEGTAADVSATDVQRVCPGLVTGLSCTGPSDSAFVVDQAVQACADAGYPLGMTRSFPVLGPLFLRLIRVQSLPSTDSARVLLIFEKPTGATPSAYVVTNGAYLTHYETNRLADGTPISVGWVEPRSALSDPATDAIAQNEVPPDLITVAIVRPVRRIAISGLRYGAPPDNADYIGFVNKGIWYGKRQGMWMISSYDTAQARYSGYFTFQAEAITKGFEDWSTQGHLQFPSGKNVPVTPDDITAMMSPAYVQGIIKPVNGAIRVGYYPLTDFSQIFGFGGGSSFLPPSGTGQ